MKLNIITFLKDISRKILSKELEQRDIENASLLSRLKEDSESNRLIEEYPNKSIYYRGRVLPLSTKRIPVPVSVLVTPNDGKIIQDLKDWKLYQTKEDIETLIPKIHWEVMNKYFSYKSDMDTWGLTEFWEFPFEIFAKLEEDKNAGFDCDSFAILLVSYIRAAGVPPGYVWAVTGMTSYGGGHCTVYCYSKVDKKYHHIYSTSRIHKKKVSEYPTHEDARNGKDEMGIVEVINSFNDVCSRTLFETEELEKMMSSI